MAKSRKPDQQPQQPDAAEPNSTEATPAVTEQPVGSKLAQAEEKLERMLKTNKVCFRHQNDFALIERELKERFHYSDSELEHILQPKGQRMIPGFGYSEIERQRQYVDYLKKNAGQRGSHAERVEQSREEGQGPTR